MSDFGIINFGRPISAEFEEGGGFGTTFHNRATKTIAVDVAASETKATISRGGFTIPELTINPEIVGSFLDDLVVVTTKVVTQTIAPGTAVAVGTSIDVVLAETSNLPVAVIPGIHAQFADLTMAELHQNFTDVQVVKDLVRTKGSAADLTADDISVLTSALADQQIDVSSTPGQTAASAFTAIQAAFTFQG